MGIYDRDYYRAGPPPRRFATFSMLSVTTWLIIINVVVFLLDGILRQYQVHHVLASNPDLHPFLRIRLQQFMHRPLESWGYFSMATAIGQWQVWRFFTFQFFHADLSHLFSNMLGLFFFGPLVESYWGSRRFLAFYLLCGIAGAALYMLLLLAGVLIGSPYVPLVGASAGIFGVLVAAAFIAPNITVMLLFPPIPMQLKYLAMIMLGIAVYTTFTNGQNAGGEAAHLGGAILGFVFMQFPWLLKPFDFAFLRRRRHRSQMQFRFDDWSRDTHR